MVVGIDSAGDNNDHRCAMSEHSIKWIDGGREPLGPSDPAHQHGINLDLAHGQIKTCTVELPYPAPRCGYFSVQCLTCRVSVSVVANGRADDPRMVMIACKPAHRTRYENKLHKENDEKPLGGARSVTGGRSRRQSSITLARTPWGK
jgi:hypothetical protein